MNKKDTNQTPESHDSDLHFKIEKIDCEGGKPQLVSRKNELELTSKAKSVIAKPSSPIQLDDQQLSIDSPGKIFEATSPSKLMDTPNTKHGSASPLKEDEQDKAAGAKSEHSFKLAASQISRGSTITRKSTLMKIEVEKHQVKSYVFAIFCAIWFGCSNFVSEVLSSRLGMEILYAQSFGLLFTALTYYAVTYIKWYRKQLQKPLNEREAYFSKKNSYYYEEYIEEAFEGGAVEKEISDADSFDISSQEGNGVNEGKTREYLAFSLHRLSCPLSRALSLLAITFTIYYTFFFGAKGGMNGGVLSSIFATSLVFTIIVFSKWYGQSISRRDMLGTLMIICCILFIALGGVYGAKEVSSDDDQEDEIKDRDLYVFLSILMATLAGASMTYNTISINYCINNGFDLNQATYDANMMVFFPAFIMYMVEMYVNDFPYTAVDTTMAGSQMVMTILGTICFSFGVQFGKAGPVSAVENAKTIVQTLLGVAFMNRIPNALQIVGLCSGAIGVVVIIFQKEKSVDKTDEKEKDSQ